MNSGLIFTLLAFVFVAVCLITGKIGASIACGLAVVFLWFAGVIDMTASALTVRRNSQISVRSTGSKIRLLFSRRGIIAFTGGYVPGDSPCKAART